MVVGNMRSPPVLLSPFECPGFRSIGIFGCPTAVGIILEIVTCRALALVGVQVTQGAALTLYEGTKLPVPVSYIEIKTEGYLGSCRTGEQYPVIRSDLTIAVSINYDYISGTCTANARQ